MKEEETLRDYLVSVVPIGKRNAQTSAEIFVNYTQGRATRSVVRSSLSILRRKGLIQSETIGSGRQRLYWKERALSKKGIIERMRGMRGIIFMRKKEGRR